MKKITSLALAAVLSASTLLTVPANAAEASAEVSAADSAETLRGWQTIDGNTYYYNRSGVKLTGWYRIKGSTYYFGKDGVMRTGRVRIGKRTYNFGKDGKLIRRYTMIVNGSKLSTKAKPYYSGKVLMVPLEDTALALGYLYSADKDGTITVDDDYIQKAEITVGSDQVKFTGLLSVIDLSRDITMDSAAEEKNGTVYVPLNFWEEFFNDVSCNADNVITISPSMCYID